MESDTLARRLGTTTHVSPLLMKAKRLGLHTAEDLERLAIQRGCRYYDVYRDSSVVREDSPITARRADFSNAELAIALLSLHAPVTLHRKRLGAAMLSAPDVKTDALAALSIQEGCADIVHYIADCAANVEPDRQEWKQLQSALSAHPYVPTEMPHYTRFIEMTGVTRGKVGLFKHWIRPVEALALAP